MNDLLKEMNERLKYLESIEQTDENIARIKEITLAIVRVQQIVLDELTKKSLSAEEFIREKIRAKHNLIGQMHALWKYDVNGEDCLRWSKEFSDLCNQPTPFTPIPAEDEAKILARMYGLANGFEADIQSAIIDQQNTINSLKAHGVDANYEEKVLAILKSM